MKFSPRHNKLIELKDNIDILKMGERNREYLNLLEKIRTQAVAEIKKEQVKAGILPKNILTQNSENI